DHEVQTEPGPCGADIAIYIGSSLEAAAWISPGPDATPRQLEQLAQEAELWADRLREQARIKTIQAVYAHPAAQPPHRPGSSRPSCGTTPNGSNGCAPRSRTTSGPPSSGSSWTTGRRSTRHSPPECSS